MNIKIQRVTEGKNLLNKILNDLYHLEDLNNYKNNTIGKCINQLQKVKLISDERGFKK